MFTSITSINLPYNAYNYHSSCDLFWNKQYDEILSLNDIYKIHHFKQMFVRKTRFIVVYIIVEVIAGIKKMALLWLQLCGHATKRPNPIFHFNGAAAILPPWVIYIDSRTFSSVPNRNIQSSRYNQGYVYISVNISRLHINAL